MNLAAQTILIIGCSIIIVALIGDMILRAKWSSWYFSKGITIYRKQYIADIQNPLNLKLLEKRTYTPLLPIIIFKKQPDGQIFFRRRLINWKPYQFFIIPYYDVMHGTILQESDKYTIIGKLDLGCLSLLTFTLTSIIWSLLEVKLNATLWPFMACALAGIYAIILLLVSYLIQVHRYNKMGILISNVE